MSANSVQAVTPHCSRSVYLGLLTFFSILMMLGVPGAALAADLDVVWTGGLGDWDDPNRWDLGVVPDNYSGLDTYNVFIDGGKAGIASAVDLYVPIAINTLWVDLADALNVQATLMIEGGLVRNDGTIRLGDGGSGPGWLEATFQPVSLMGTGVLELNHDGSGIVGGARVTNEADHTIRGRGLIGTEQFTNRGMVEASGAGAVLTVDAGQWPGAAVNSGTIRAKTGTEVAIESSYVINQEGSNQGLIHADSGTVAVRGSTVLGGELRVDGAAGQMNVEGGSQVVSATINVNEGGLGVQASSVQGSTINVSPWGAMTLNGTVDGGMVTNAGTIGVQGESTLSGGNLRNQASGRVTIGGDAELRLGQGTYVNDGRIDVGFLGASDPNWPGTLRITGESVRLTGTGAIELAGGAIIGEEGGPRLVNEAGHTIRGSGGIGAHTYSSPPWPWLSEGIPEYEYLCLTNRGLIEATGEDQLRIRALGGWSYSDPSLPGSVNAGIMRANPGARLRFEGSRFVNYEGGVDGLIHANDGTVSMLLSRFRGGRFEVDGPDGVLRLEGFFGAPTDAGCEIYDAHINVSQGALVVEYGSKLVDTSTMIHPGATSVLTGATINGGTFTNAGHVSVGTSQYRPGATFTGGNLVNLPTGEIDAHWGTLTFGPGLYVNGGRINLGSGDPIDGDAATSRLLSNDHDVILAGSGVLNMNGDASLIGGVALTNESGHTVRGRGRIGDDGAFGQSPIWLNNRGLIEATYDESWGGLLEIRTAVDEAVGDSVPVSNSSINSGVLRAGPGAELRLVDSVLLNQDGTASGLIHADNGTVGLVRSEVTGGGFRVDGPDGMLAMEASRITAANIDLNNGQMWVDATSKVSASTLQVGRDATLWLDGYIDGIVNIEAGTIDGGTILNHGTIAMSGWDNHPAMGLLTGGNLNNLPSGDVRLDNAILGLTSGTYLNDGTMTVGLGVESIAAIGVAGDVVLTGGGAVNLGGSHHLFEQGSGIGGFNAGGSQARLVNDAGHTIQGDGWIGDVPLRALLEGESLADGVIYLPMHLSLVNRGMIQAPGAGDTLVIDTPGSPSDPNTADSFNSGTMRAGPGATLLFDRSQLVNQEGGDRGLIHADGGTVRLSGSRIIGGDFLVSEPNGLLEVVPGGDAEKASSEIRGAHIDVADGMLRVGNTEGWWGWPLLGSTISDSTIHIASSGGLLLDNGHISGGLLVNEGTIETWALLPNEAANALSGGNLRNQASGGVYATFADLRLGAGTYVNDGLISVGSGLGWDSGSLLIGDGDVALEGSGLLSLNGSGIRAYTDGDRLINGAEHTIRGNGSVGYGVLRLTNRGTIETSGYLTMRTYDSALPYDPLYRTYDPCSNLNSGTMRAFGGGELHIVRSQVTNVEQGQFGLIQADGGEVHIEGSMVEGGHLVIDRPNGAILLEDYSDEWGYVGGSRISNAQIDVNDGLLSIEPNCAIANSTTSVSPWGRIELRDARIAGGSLNNAGVVDVVGWGGRNVLSGSCLNNLPSGVVNVVEDQLLLEPGSYHNDGRINVGTGESYNVKLLLGGEGVVSLTGLGVMTLNDGQITTSGSGRERLVNEVGHTIRGYGHIGSDYESESIALTNRGTIEALPGSEYVEGLEINTADVFPDAGDAEVMNYNSGTIRAGTDAKLVIRESTIINQEGSAEGLIHADDGRVEIRTSTVVGGRLQVDGPAGEIVVEGDHYVTKSEIIASDIRVDEGYFRLNHNSRVLASTVRVGEEGTLVIAGGYHGVSEAAVDGGSIVNSGTIQVGGMPAFHTAFLSGGNLNNTATGVVNIVGLALCLDPGEYRNDGSINVLTNGISHLAVRGGTVRLAGSGMLNTGSDEWTVSIAARYGDAYTGRERLVNGPDHTIQGAGLIGRDLSITNQGRISANVPGAALIIGQDFYPDVTDDGEGGTYEVVNTGVMQATNGAVQRLTADHLVNDGLIQGIDGGTVKVLCDVVGAGRWVADGGSIFVGEVDVATTGSISVLNRGDLTLDFLGSAMSGSDLLIDETGAIDVAGVMTLSGDLAFAGTDESLWAWQTDSTLVMTGGIGASILSADSWAMLEIGGFDLGIDPNNHIGDPAGFLNNFDLATLVVGDGAHVMLADLFDNGNRGGLFGLAEALYVDTLILEGPDSVLNLNGLHLYYNNLIGGGSIIVPEPATIALVLLGGLAAWRRRR
ncbi:MAG: PEP-CTERM sorting domain-containing protein [Phycisphaerae bacterium]|nr:PEP-CTERM sorting domain-containing protein [Phycisphaerae bacterium]